MSKTNGKVDTNGNSSTPKKRGRKSNAEKEAARLEAIARAEAEAAAGELSFKEEAEAEESDLGDAENAARGITELTEESTGGDLDHSANSDADPDDEDGSEDGDADHSEASSTDACAEGEPAPDAQGEGDDEANGASEPAGPAGEVGEGGAAGEPAKLVTNRKGMISALKWIAETIPKWDWGAVGLDQNALCGLAITAGNYAKKAVIVRRNKPAGIVVGAVVRPRSERMRADLLERFGATFTVKEIDGEWAETLSATGKPLPLKLKQIELAAAEDAS